MTTVDLIQSIRDDHEKGGNLVVATCICGGVWPCRPIQLADALERAEKVIPVAREMRRQEPGHWRAGNHCTQCGFSWPCAWAAFDEALDEYDGGKA